MELSALSNVDLINAFKVPEISSSLDDSSTGKVQGNGAFEALFNSAANMISDANDYSNAAEVEEMKYSMGETESIHDLQICRGGERLLYVGLQRIDEPAVLMYNEVLKSGEESSIREHRQMLGEL